ncbi:hypothetical protein L5515_011101 [Caenorhabditis briggsae]|uniref:Uncharacterized protein n=1 Tax=Caenorhabditis briggsae TaxID=6238 RepID=A0AAE9JGT3_CAEBR|nr:hypothetical protein L5515_011100 [Caenorhabditis briggsae]UMM28120.1 hypothetical protein L5515_011101 [Caenorhabditis briggsae]
MSFTDNDMCDQVAVIAYDLDSALNTVPSGLQTLLEQNYPLSMLKEEKIEELVTRYIHCPQVGNMARRVIGKINSMEQKESMKANEKSRKRGWSMESFSSSGSSTNSTEPISKPKNSQPVPSNMTGSSSCLPSIHPTSVQHEKNFVRRVTPSESRNTMMQKRTDLVLNSKRTSSYSPPSYDELMGLIASKRTNPAKFVPRSKPVTTTSSSNFKNAPTSAPTKTSPEVKKTEKDRMERMMRVRREVKKEAEKKAEEGVKSVKQMLMEARNQRIAEAQKAKSSGLWEELEQPKAKRGRYQTKYR